MSGNAVVRAAAPPASPSRRATRACYGSSFAILAEQSPQSSPLSSPIVRASPQASQLRSPAVSPLVSFQLPPSVGGAGGQGSGSFTLTPTAAPAMPTLTMPNNTGLPPSMSGRGIFDYAPQVRTESILTSAPTSQEVTRTISDVPPTPARTSISTAAPVMMRTTSGGLATAVVSRTSVVSGVATAQHLSPAEQEQAQVSVAAVPQESLISRRSAPAPLTIFGSLGSNSLALASPTVSPTYLAGAAAGALVGGGGVPQPAPSPSLGPAASPRLGGPVWTTVVKPGRRQRSQAQVEGDSAAPKPELARELSRTDGEVVDLYYDQKGLFYKQHGRAAKQTRSVKGKRHIEGQVEKRRAQSERDRNKDFNFLCEEVSDDEQ